MEFSHFIYYRVVFRFRHALALTSSQARSKQGSFPPACCLARLHRYYEPLGLPPGSVRFPPSGFMRTVFARLGCQVGSLLFRPLPDTNVPPPLPRRGPAVVPGQTAVYCLRRAMSGSALPNTFRLIICRGCSVPLMLRPAGLLPSLSKALDGPAWPVASLLLAGACYRTLRRLSGQGLSLLEERVFQDAP